MNTLVGLYNLWMERIGGVVRLVKHADEYTEIAWVVGTIRTSIVVDVRFFERTGIRAVEAADLTATRKWRSDPRVSGPALGRRFPINELGEQAWLASLGAGSFPTSVVWAICEDKNSSIIGISQIVAIDWIDRTAEFGIWIGPEFWGQGHGTQAAWLVTEHALRDLGLRQLRLHVLPDNVRAIHSYERIGFEHEAVLVSAVLQDGVPADLLIMRLDSSTERKPPNSL